MLFGQTWHPMFVTDVFPQVVSFNTGSPFQPFSRNPQIRLTQSFDKFNLIAALLTQRDVTSNGPAGFSSSYLRNNLIPSAHLQLQYKSESFVTGAGVDYKSLTPRISTTKIIKRTKRFLVFLGCYMQNMYSLVLLGWLREFMDKT